MGFSTTIARLMHRTRFWALVCLGALGSAASFSCGSDEATSHPHSDSGGAAGEAGATASPLPSAGGGAGAESSASGRGGASEPGGNEAAGGGAGGSASNTTPGGDGGGLGLGGSSDLPGVEGEQLDLCARLSGLVVHADNVGRAYSNAAYDDCRIKWVIPVGSPLYDFRNKLVTWSLELWGCQGLPVDTFALVHETPALSSGDVGLLIGHYMAAAQNELDLSATEHEEMQAALERLAAPLIADNSSEPSRSQCASNGGTGGAGGAEGAAGNAGSAGNSELGGAPAASGGAP